MRQAACAPVTGTRCSMTVMRVGAEHGDDVGAGVVAVDRIDQADGVDVLGPACAVIVAGDVIAVTLGRASQPRGRCVPTSS